MIHKLIEHATWSNGQFLHFIANQGWQEAPGRVISHVVLATDVWIRRTRGEAPARAYATQFLGPARLESMVAAQCEALHLLMRTKAETMVHYKRFTGEAGSDTAGDIVTHIMTHGCHHRGQIAFWFARRNVKPPNCDFIDYCRHLDRVASIAL